ncbi:tetratricopeptide repeat protein, partial [Enhygromyxa salina]|uniref:tetratricopeptide repeat protein n=1 Tax=Enhygromyxa salina TaxID=215803 RepID=UPI0015E5A499
MPTAKAGFELARRSSRQRLTMAAPDSALPCPLPARADNDAEALEDYRAKLGDERAFARARRKLRELGDWSSMAKLLVEHAAAIAGEPDKHSKVAELASQAYELFAERVGDQDAAVHALARALLAQPENDRAYERLYLTYQDQDRAQDLATLLRWRMAWARRAQPTLLAGLHYGYAELQRTRFHAIGEAVEHYEQALAQDPMLSEASDQLIVLHLAAGAWQRASRLMEAELSQLEAHPSYAADPAVAARISQLHLRLAEIASEQHQDLASAARHLQAAIKTTPQNLEALRAFGTLYLGSGKASDEGMAKASAIFLKAAQLARAAGDEGQALKLLRRTLSLRPDHFEAGQMFAELLAEQAHWMELDDHYRHVLTYAEGPPRVGVLLRRAENLDQRLQRREEARVCYEEAGQHQSADGEAWLALERIYRDSADWTALATLLEWRIEQLGDAVPTASLLEAAKVFHHQLDDHERAALFYFKVLEREPFDPEAFEGYKEHFRRKHAWGALRDLVLYQIDQATDAAHAGHPSPLDDDAFAEEYVELAEVCERRLGDVDGAIDAWTRMAQAYPHDPRPREQMARIQKRTRMWDNMVRVQEAELARTQDPRKRLEIIKRLAQIYRDRQVNPQRAIELYSEMLYLAPDDITATRALTALYDRAGDHNQVIALLRQQYDIARSDTERISLLRRMAELWHHELAAFPEAMWACEEILSLTGNDFEALHRLQILAQESNDLELLVAALEREHKVTGKATGKAQILRRLARVTENRLQDPERAAHYWSRLLDLEPDNLEVNDKMVAVYDAAGRFEELAELLGRAAASSKTPIIRQLDYLLRLGYLAQAGLGDPELARSAYERVIKIRPDHRRALDALATLYRIDEDYEGLAEILGKLREIAASDEEAFAFAWEQAQILLHQVDDPAEAAEVLAWIARTLRPGDAEVNRSLLEAYREAELRPELIGHAELMLLGTSDTEQRGYLYGLIVSAWQAVDNKRAAMRATERQLREFPSDPQGHAQLAELQEELGEFEHALRSLARKLELVAHDPDQQIATLRRMAEIADLGIGDRNRALELLRRASGIDPTDPELRDHIEQFAEAHGTWKELLEIDELRLNRLAEMGDVAGQLDICTEASRIAENELDDADRSFAWARRGYFIARQQQLDFDQGFRRLRKLAEGYGLWTALLEVSERELERETFSDDFELVERMIGAAEIAENQLDDPKRAVRYLQRALQQVPNDDEVTRRIQTIAESHELWDALLALAEHRLEHADGALGRFDAHCAISRIHERKLDDPRAAFATMRRAWQDLGERDESLAEEALDIAINLAESHELWRELADHHASLAHERASAGQRIEAVDALAEAAQIVDERLEDPISSMRVLLRGVTLDSEGDVIIPRLRELAARVDEDAERGAHDGVKVGALVELRALGELIANAPNDSMKITLLIERAEIREQRLDDGTGALGEWLRILTLDRLHYRARDEAERLASRYDLWHRFMLIPAWELEQATDNDGQAQLLVEIADLYEHKLGRAEYALRARLEAWRRAPGGSAEGGDPERCEGLPPLEGPLGDPHADLWRLAGLVGTYGGPALPNDPVLSPSVPAPELHDRKLWARARLDPQHLTPPGGADSAESVVAKYDDPHSEGDHDELTAVAPIDLAGGDSAVVEISRVEVLPSEESIVEEVSRVELIDNVSEVIEISRVEELGAIQSTEQSVVELIDEIEELDELDEFEEFETNVSGGPIEEMSSAELESASVSGEIGSFADPRKARREARKNSIPGTLDPSLDFGTERLGSKTIPLPKPAATPTAPSADDDFDLAQGLPQLPQTAGPVLPKRPSVASAWEELAAAYAELPTANKAQKVEVQLACARLWEIGAQLVERAFVSHERALLLIPEQPASVASLEALAERHDARPRLLRAWSHLLSEAALPEHVVALNLRIAAFHESDEALDAAEARYRAVLAVNPAHAGALRKLLVVYERLERRPEYIETYADLLNAERNELADGERVERSLRLAELYEGSARSDDALELLRFLVRDFPERPEVHARVTELLLRREEWPQAIDAMRTANESLFDPDLQADNLARIAEVYTEQLALPDRAIDAWNDYRELRPEDERALIQLQALYLETSRWEKLLPILDARLDHISVDVELSDDERQAARVKLLVVKARALQEGLGDELAATETLEQLADDVPDDDEVALGLSRLYRRTDRFEEGVTLLRERVDRLRAEHESDAEQDPELRQRIRDLSLTLARVVHEEGKRHAVALELVERALELSADDHELLTLRTKLARALNDMPLLVDGLERLGEPDGVLEAADIARKRLDEPDRAEAAYRRVLALAKGERGVEPSASAPESGDDTDWATRLTRSIEGLVRLRIDADDIEGATAFMDEQLAELAGSSIRAKLLTEIGRITYRTTGDVAAARARFNAALETDPDHAEARLGLGELLLDSGNLAEAEKQLESAVEALTLVRDQGHLVEGLVLLARALEAADRSGEAYRRLTTALRHDPDDLSIRLAVVRNRFGARRARDVMTAVDQLEQRLEARQDDLGRPQVLAPRDAKLAAEIHAIAGECELGGKQPERAQARLLRALEFDAENRRALAAIVPWLRERGDLIEAAGYAARLAETFEEPHERGSAWVDAGMLFHDAAQLVADGEAGEADGGRELTASERRARTAELEREAFEAVRMGLVLVSDSPTPVLELAQLEVAFRASAVHDRSLALRCLERLLLRETTDEQRLELLLEGVHVALPERVEPAASEGSGPSSTDGPAAAAPSPSLGESGPQPSLELAAAYAERAVELAPLSSAAVLAKAQVLEAAGRTDELQPLVSSFLSQLEQADAEPRGAGADEPAEPDEDLRARVTLLIRLAALQHERAPAEAAASLEQAARLTAQMRQAERSEFGLDHRKQLASLYERLSEAGEATGEHKVLANHRGLLGHDPLYLPSLRALARHHRAAGELQRARALYSVIALVEPADEDAKQFVADHCETLSGDTHELDIAAVTGELPSDGGVSPALSHLWEAGQNLLGDQLGRLEFDTAARVSPVADSALAKAWREVLRRLGQTKVALVADAALDAREAVEPLPARAWAEARCQLPPIIIAGPKARDASEAQRGALVFALARALYYTRPEVVLVAGLDRARFSTITSAMLLALHPRHGSRKQAARNASDPLSKLGHELGRKLPIRVARQIGNIFKDHETERFDSRVLRAWVRRAGDRVGLLLSGELETAIEILAGSDGPSTLSDLVAADADLRALLAFAVSGAYADGRRQLGYVVEGDAAPSERIPSPPIIVELSGTEARVPAPLGTPGSKPASTSASKPISTSGSKPDSTSGSTPDSTSARTPDSTSGSKPDSTPVAPPQSAAQPAKAELATPPRSAAPKPKASPTAAPKPPPAAAPPPS